MAPASAAPTRSPRSPSGWAELRICSSASPPAARPVEPAPRRRGDLALDAARRGPPALTTRPLAIGRGRAAGSAPRRPDRRRSEDPVADGHAPRAPARAPERLRVASTTTVGSGPASTRPSCPPSPVARGHHDADRGARPPPARRPVTQALSPDGVRIARPPPRRGRARRAARAPPSLGGREEQDGQGRACAHWPRMGKAADRGRRGPRPGRARAEPDAPVRRTKVIPIDRGHPMPLGLGDDRRPRHGVGGRPAQRPLPVRARWFTRPPQAPGRPRTARPSSCSRTTSGSTARNLEFSELVKAAQPAQRHDPRRARHAEVRGRRRDVLRGNPHVDIAVHGEGEVTTAEVLDALVGVARRRRRRPVACSRDVPGLVVPRRRPGRPHRRRGTASPTSTSIPSPFLTGLFDVHADGRVVDGDPRDEPRLPLRLHVLRLGLGHAVAHPQVRPRPGLRRARVVRQAQGPRGSSSPTPTSGSSSATSRSPRRSPSSRPVRLPDAARRPTTPRTR